MTEARKDAEARLLHAAEKVFADRNCDDAIEELESAAIAYGRVVYIENHVGPTYRRHAHAAHTSGGGGWDLETWDAVVASSDPRERPEGVPLDADYGHGYVDAEGRRHAVYSRRAPLSGPPCSTCEAVL